jgi:beta-glucuronidase
VTVNRVQLGCRAAALAFAAVALVVGVGVVGSARATPRATIATTSSTPVSTTASTTTSTTPATSPVTSAAAPPTKGALASDGPASRYLLGAGWLYRPDPGGAGIADGWWRDRSDTTGWKPTTIPNSYNAGDYSNKSMYDDVGWYRRDFTLPSNAFAPYVPVSARSWLLQFESVNYAATVWLNGRLLGTHKGAYLPFQFDVGLLRPGVNRLVVRVTNQRGGDDLPPGPSGGWWNFGGILDAVYLRPVQRADLDALLIRPQLRCPTCAATIFEQATVHNLTRAPQTVRLTGRYGSAHLIFGATTIAPGATWSPTATAVIAHPQLWAPGSPTLYAATAQLTDTAGRRLGGYSYQSGIREITRTPDGRLELNGRLLDLRGVNLHEQSSATGAALSVAQMRQVIGRVKELGATLIRAHYPLNPELEQMADRDGILLWSEVPVYQVGTKYVAKASWRSRALALLTDNIQTNEDHPSILLWSIGNELPTPATAGEATYIRAAAALARRLDPSRPVGMAVSDWPGVSCQTAYAPLDVVGVNEYFGWFDAGGGTTDDRDGLSPFLDSVRACYPYQAVLVTEFGVDGDRAGPVEVRGTYAFQSNSLAFHLGVFASKPWLSGAVYFNLQDFAARPGYDGSNPIGNPPFVTNGLFDTSGNPKPAFAVMQSLYNGTVQIAAARGPQARSRHGAL